MLKNKILIHFVLNLIYYQKLKIDKNVSEFFLKKVCWILASIREVNNLPYSFEIFRDWKIYRWLTYMYMHMNLNTSCSFFHFHWVFFLLGVVLKIYLFRTIQMYRIIFIKNILTFTVFFGTNKEMMTSWHTWGVVEPLTIAR